METWIYQVLSSEQAGYSVLVAVFLLGFISIFTCGCNFSIIALVAGYSGTVGSAGIKKRVLLNGLLFFIGLMVSMTILGGMIGFAGEWISQSTGRYWKVIAGLISVFFGLLTMELIPVKIPGLSVLPSKSEKGAFSGLLIGLTIGGLTLLTSTCCNPIFPVVMAVSFVKGSFYWGMLLMMAYALGYGLTFTGISIAIGLGFKTASQSFTKVGTFLKYLGGITMVIVGFYLLLTF